MREADRKACATSCQSRSPFFGVGVAIELRISYTDAAQHAGIVLAFSPPAGPPFITLYRNICQALMQQYCVAGFNGVMSLRLSPQVRFPGAPRRRYFVSLSSAFGMRLLSDFRGLLSSRAGNFHEDLSHQEKLEERSSLFLPFPISTPALSTSPWIRSQRPTVFDHTVEESFRIVRIPHQHATSPLEAELSFPRSLRYIFLTVLAECPRSSSLILPFLSPPTCRTATEARPPPPRRDHGFYYKPRPAISAYRPGPCAVEPSGGSSSTVVLPCQANSLFLFLFSFLSV